jgi:hypothetical protein
MGKCLRTLANIPHCVGACLLQALLILDAFSSGKAEGVWVRRGVKGLHDFEFMYREQMNL